jgi:hypothetical protein
MMKRIHGFSTVTPFSAADAIVAVVRHASATAQGATHFISRLLPPDRMPETFSLTVIVSVLYRLEAEAAFGAVHIGRRRQPGARVWHPIRSLLFERM